MPLMFDDQQQNPRRKRQAGAPPSVTAGLGTTSTAPPAYAARQAGQNLRLAAQDVRSNAVALANRGMRAGVDLTNSLIYPVRAGVGAVEDFKSGFAGTPARPGAGQPVPGFAAPQIPSPSDRARIIAGIPTAPNPGAPPAAASAAARAALMGNTVTNIDSDGRVVSPAQMNARVQASGGVPAVAPAAAAPSAQGAPTIDSGVVLPGNRKLPLGAMVNGVPTFSDGSGGPGAPPRTMTGADIANLGRQLNTVPSTAFTDPVLPFNSPNSEDNIAARMRADQGPKFGITPQMNADADLAAVMNRDPRSTLGRAALNLERSAEGANRLSERRMYQNELQGLGASVAQAGMADVNNAARLGETNAAGQNALTREAAADKARLAQIGLQNAGDLARTKAAGQFGVQEAQARADGALGAKSLLSDKDANAQALTLIKTMPQMFGLDPMMNVIDAKTGKSRPPTPEESARVLQAAVQRVRMLAGEGVGGGATQVAAAAQPIQEPVPSADSIAILRKNPSLAAQFDATYHQPGLAKRILEGGSGG